MFDAALPPAAITLEPATAAVGAAVGATVGAAVVGSTIDITTTKF